MISSIAMEWWRYLEFWYFGMINLSIENKIYKKMRINLSFSHVIDMPISDHVLNFFTSFFEKVSNTQQLFEYIIN